MFAGTHSTLHGAGLGHYNGTGAGLGMGLGIAAGVVDA
jgi:hypothetical protein